MSRSASVSVPRRELYVVPERRASLELEDVPRHLHHDQQREYDSWPCDSFFLLPDAVLAMDAGAFRADLMSLDPVLSASLPDWDLPGLTGCPSALPSAHDSPHRGRPPAPHSPHRTDRRSLTLLDHHEGLTVHSAGQGTILIGGGGDGRESSGGGSGVSGAPSANGHSAAQQPQQLQQPKQDTSSAANKRTPAQKDAYWFAQGDNTPPPKQQRASLAGPNDLFFGEEDKSSGLSYKDREERLRQLRDRQQHEKQQKLEELKEQAAAAQRFREQQENERRRRLDEIRIRDAGRRTQVEERKRIIQQAEQDRREAVLRKNAFLSSQEREQRMESKRRNEKSSIVFAFGSSTPRMLDPRDSSSNTSSYFGSRRATSTTNVHLVETSISRRASECSDMDLSRKRATSAHSLDRKTDDLRMSSSMYEVFHWDDSSPSYHKHPPTTQGTRLTKSRDSSLERKIPPSALSWVRSSSPKPLDSSSVPLPSKDTTSAPASSTSSTSSDKTPTNTSQSRYSVWEFGDNFTALGPANQSSGGSGNLASSSPAVTPTSSTRYSRRTASVFTGAGCTVGGEDLMTRSMTAAIPATAARRRTDLLPAMPSLRDSPGSSRSSPRHRSPGMRSGTVTPNSPSRPTSALSQGSNNSSQVSLRSRTSPRKPRPLSIAGSSLSSADKPRDTAPLSRESRPMERKLSVGSTPSSKPTRAKSAGSDSSAPATPAKGSPAAKATTPKKTPSQVKAESAAKKAVEKSKTTPKAKAQKTTPLQSPSVENKPLPGATKEKRITPPKEEKSIEPQKPKEDTPPKKLPEPDIVDVTPSKPAADAVVDSQPETTKPEEPQPQTEVQQQQKPDDNVTVIPPKIKPEKEEPISAENEQDDQEKMQAQKAAEKPVTGYASEEEYKAALAEKRRLAREAKEKEQELERQKQLAEEERERKEEEDFLKMIEEQKKAEEERLKKAIEEADRNRIEEAKRKEEEEKQREEAERIEQQKRIETEERLHREEEERQARKSRVAAIMARTRGKGGSNTPTKAEAKTPSEENKGFEVDMSVSMTDSMINNLEAVVESQQSEQQQQQQPPPPPPVAKNAVDSSQQQQESHSGSQPSSDFSTTEPVSDVSSRSSQPATQVENTVTVSTPDVAISTSVEQTLSNTEATPASENTLVDNVISGITSVKLEEPHVNGDSPVPMDTTPTHSVDLLGNITGSDVNTRNHNGVDSTPAQTSQGTDNLGSLDPLISTHNTTITPAASNFEQIIDLSQTKLSNEDAVNSNPPSPFIAFEQNLNKKQSQENTSTVPDLLL